MAFAVIGPGRVGAALARRWCEGGLELGGFRGRSSRSVRAAAAFCGARGPAEVDDAGLRGASLVLVAVGDEALTGVAAECASAGLCAPGSLWVHTSGFHDLGPLAPVQSAGGRTGSLHPVCALPDAEAGYRALGGRPAVLQGGDDSLGELRDLAVKAGMSPTVFPSGADRRLYHAACVLASGGTTALFDLVEELLRDACRFARADAARLAAELARGAVDASAERGARDALSGPVVRGDAEVVRAHLEVLSGRNRGVTAAYRALMARAVELAVARGALDARDGDRIASILSGDG